MAVLASPLSNLESDLADRYRIEGELGSGGMATVYLAHDIRHNRDVALKVLRTDVAESIESARFLREIELAARLQHPNILQLFDSGAAGGTLYYVMPKVDGTSLRERLEDSGKLPIDEALRLTCEVADALDYAHRHGVIHRDVKPGNIMMHDTHAMVADFGIGKALTDAKEYSLTTAGVAVGTPAYMSPEQASGEEVDGRSDIYSLGCVLYEMLTGEPPFMAATILALMAKRMIQTPADVSLMREGVSRDVAAVVKRMLARAPEDRFATAAMVVAALSQARVTAAHPASEKSIAVLPFANMSADPDNEFFADGITEDILNALTQIADLHVAGRTSSFSFKGRNVDLRTIGEQLNVSTVLEGSVRRAGNRVRITAQLINAADGYHLWSERYDRDIEDVFAVQDEIATAIAKRLAATLHPGVTKVREERATENIAAYEAYLKGRTFMYRRGAATRQGIVQMEKALSLDPEYGLAWSGLADGHTVLGYYGQIEIEAASAAAGRAADKAMSTAPNLAEAHASRAIASLVFDWDFPAAEREFRTAMALNPSYVQGACWYYLFYLGFASRRWSEALRGLVQLETVEPRSAYLASVLAVAHAIAGDRDQAVKYSDRAMELEPCAFLSMWARQVTCHARGEWARAIQTADTLLGVSGRHQYSLHTLAASLVENGQTELAHAVYDEMRARSRREPISPLALASVAAAVGDAEAAIDYAGDALACHDPAVIMYAYTWQQTRFLRDLPEFLPMITEQRFVLNPRGRC